MHFIDRQTHGPYYTRIKRCMAVSIALRACSCLRCDLRDATFAQQEINSSKTMHQPKPCLRARLNCRPYCMISLADDVCCKVLDAVKYVEFGFMTRTEDPTDSCQEVQEPHVTCGSLVQVYLTHYTVVAALCQNLGTH